MKTKIPIVIDTDIGDDIDDIWALGLAIASDMFDIRLVSVCYADIEYKVRVAYDFLTKTGNQNTALAKGIELKRNDSKPHYGRVKDLKPDALQDAPACIAEQVKKGVQNIIALGPLENIARFVAQYKDLKDQCRIIIMGGSVYQGYINQSAPCAEYNIRCAPKAFQTVLKSGFEIVLAPLDVCRDFIIDGEYFAALKNSSNIVIKTILDYYQEWHQNYIGGAIKYDKDASSGILYDILPILYLMDAENFIKADIKIIGTKNGYTIPRFYGRRVKALLGLKDKERALSYVTNIFLGTAK